MRGRHDQVTIAITRTAYRVHSSSQRSSAVRRSIQNRREKHELSPAAQLGGSVLQDLDDLLVRESTLSH